MKYQPEQFESKWRDLWISQKSYAAKINPDKPKKYILDMFPYPSGDGLHVGHFKLYVASDIIARYYRASGHEVLHPMGWDAFGLPAENYAIKTGVQPKVTTQQNIANIKRQMQMVGFSYDWDREINTTDPKYYKWTQWIFLQLYKHGLAYEAVVPINWCPVDKTGLANEEVVNGLCERCGAKVEQKEIRQWLLKITEYADRLLQDLDELDWPESIKEMQRNWIGRSQGATLRLDIKNSSDSIEVFTTRIDTIFGITAIILAPEYKSIKYIVTKEKKDQVSSYIKSVIDKDDIQRGGQDSKKTGVFTGAYAIHPLTGQELPIWVADYVLNNYGSGAIMLVPAHDQRDKTFAQEYHLEIVPVIDKHNKLINSQEFNGLDIDIAKKEIIKKLVELHQGESKIQYKLRDWVFSRQRYWGEPIPLIHCPECGTLAMPEDQLPLLLPEVELYQPTGTGESPLAAISEWVNTTCPQCHGMAKRETNTMPQWAGSCWYYLRFCDPDNSEQLIGHQADQYWSPVDWYIGGAEHAVLHLLYARFWHKFLYDLKVVKHNEPFQKLSSIGLVLSDDGRKMSKRWGNIITPDQIVDEFSADTLRLYEAFMGPFENTIAWDPNSIQGVYRFIIKVWDKMINEPASEENSTSNLGSLAELAVKVAQDITLIKLNTAIAAMMKWLNSVQKQPLSQIEKEAYLTILAPFAPFMCEEIWSVWGKKDSVHSQAWPQLEVIPDQTSLVRLAIQVNGKVRGVVEATKDASQEQVMIKAHKELSIAKHIDGQEIKSIVYVPGKILNIVLKHS